MASKGKDACESRELVNKVLLVFQKFDLNGDGFIDRHELQQTMVQLDASLWTDRRLNRILNALDRDHDGRIRYEEFVHWVCSSDPNQNLEAFRSALDVTQEDGKSAPRHLPGSARRSHSRCSSLGGRRTTEVSEPRRRYPNDDCLHKPRRNTLPPGVMRQVLPKAARTGLSVSGAGAVAPCPSEEKEAESGSHGRQVSEVAAVLSGVENAHVDGGTTGTDATRDASALNAVEDASADGRTRAMSDAAHERLIIFDFDGTITVDKDERCKGLVGTRLVRLRDMMAVVRASAVRCILVTAQFPRATQEITIPRLQTSGLSGLFENEASGSLLRLYWDDADHGTIYNGAKAMMGKIDLIKQIIDGKNCWGQSFKPANVLFIDDDARNFKGNERVGVQTRIVGQDGMIEEDMEVVEMFAQGSCDNAAFS